MSGGGASTRGASTGVHGHGTGRHHLTLWQRFVEVNRPGPPEHSVSFRAASVAAVLIGIGACWSQGLLSPAVTLCAVVATVVGNIIAYRRRSDPWPGVKPVLAVCAIGGFVWFILTVTHNATPGDIATVEGPLAVLFAWVLSTHAFDVPSRRDVTYSLAGSTALVAVAAAQSVDLSLGLWVVGWVAACVWGLVAMWQSLSETAGVPWRPLAAAGALVVVVAVVLVGVLPAPKVSASLIFTSASGTSAPVDNPSNLTDGNSALPAHAASPSGRTGVGGYLGFARSLDTADRVALGDQVVLRVRASRPNYWVGQTFDQWNGHAWVQTTNPVNGQRVQKLTGGSPFSIPTYPDQFANLSTGQQDVQTFYVTTGGPNLVFHADNAARVYLRARSVYVTADGTIASSESMGAGTIYTVVSNDSAATPEQLRAATTPLSLSSASASASLASDPSAQITPGIGTAQLGADEQSRYLQLPHADPRVSALAASITRGIGTPAGPKPETYDRVAAIEQWMTTHVQYTVDIPPLPVGSDAVDSFLFGSRRGYCEQISTATVVLLRSLGIPAREAVGYVPGPYNPITDLYDIQAKDAHAWVQVWFPGYGWQSFDPTATVPLANPAPGSVLAHSFGAALARLPWVPLGVTVMVSVIVAWVVRRCRRQPPTWAHQVADDLARGGARSGCARRTDETLTDYGARLACDAPTRAADITWVCRLVEGATYGGIEPTADEIGRALTASRRIRSMPKRRRDRGTVDRDGDGPQGSEGPTGSEGPEATGQDPAWASAWSNDAPAASSGR